MSQNVSIIEKPGREVCTVCGGDPDGTPCDGCGGAGVLPFRLPKCGCGRDLERSGWHSVWTPAAPNQERLPMYFCTGGHLTAIRFTTVDERQAA